MSRYVLKEAQDISGAYYLVEMVPSLENQLKRLDQQQLRVFDLHETVIHTSSGSSTLGSSVLQVTLHHDHIICNFRFI